MGVSCRLPVRRVGRVMRPAVQASLASLVVLFVAAGRADAYTPLPGSPLATGEHPRLFVNADTLPDVAAKCTGAMADVYTIIKGKADSMVAETGTPDPGYYWNYLEDDVRTLCFVGMIERELGHDASAYLSRAIEYLEVIYGQSTGLPGGSSGYPFEAGITAFAAVYDWMYDLLTPTQRQRYGGELLRYYDDAWAACCWGEMSDRPFNNRYNLTLGALTYGAAAVYGAGIDASKEQAFLDWAVDCLGHIMATKDVSGADGSSVVGNLSIRGRLSPGGDEAVGTMNVAGNVELGDFATYACDLDGVGTDLFEVSGDKDLLLAGMLELRAIDKVIPDGAANPWGHTQWTIARTRGEGSVRYCFENFPDPDLEWVPDDVVHAIVHVGNGVFTADPDGDDLVVNYSSNSLKVDLFQAADGDADGDGDVDGGDVQAILSANLFGVPDPDPPADWTQGDFTDDGLVTGADIQALLGANLFGIGSYLGQDSGPAADGPAVDVVVDADGVLIDTGGTTINSYVIESAAGVFTGAAADNLGLFQEDTDTRISGGLGFTLNGQHSLGDVIGIAGIDLSADLVATYTVDGASGIYTANLIVVPEPGTLVLLAMGALGLLLLAIRRRRRT